MCKNNKLIINKSKIKNIIDYAMLSAVIMCFFFKPPEVKIYIFQISAFLGSKQ